MKDFVIELLQAVATAAATTAAVVQPAVSQASSGGGADSLVEGGEAPVV